MRALDEALSARDAEVRRLAFLELVRQPKWTEANVPRLVAALDEPSRQAQLAAMLALSPLGSQAEAAVAKLERLLGPVEADQADAKGEEGNFRGCLLATLVSIVPDREDLVARFVRVYPKQVFYSDNDDEVARYLGRSAEPGLLKALQAGEAEVRAAAVAALGNGIRAQRFPPSAAILRALTDALADGDATVRRQTCEAIALVGPAASELKPHLQKAASDTDPEVAQAAQNAIQSLENGGGAQSGGFGGQGPGGCF
jgi:HEAT repeat protein